MDISVQKVPLTHIRPDPTQSRTTFDPHKLEELKDSLRERGLISPIALHQVSESLYEIIAGERRFRAAAALGWKEIEARVYPEETSDLETELISLVENLQRVDLNPIEEARGYRALHQKHKMKQVEIAREVGKSEAVISRALDLLNLPPEIQEILSRDKISELHIRFLRKIKNVERQIDIARQIDKEGWSVRDLQRHLGEGDGDSGERAEGENGDERGERGEKARPKDPLAATWLRLTMTPQVATPGTWGVTYDGVQWILKVGSAGPDPKPYLAKFFYKLWKALDNEAKGSDPENTVRQKPSTHEGSDPNVLAPRPKGSDPNVLASDPFKNLSPAQLEKVATQFEKLAGGPEAFKKAQARTQAKNDAAFAAVKEQMRKDGVE